MKCTTMQSLEYVLHSKKYIKYRGLNILLRFVPVVIRWQVNLTPAHTSRCFHLFGIIGPLLTLRGFFFFPGGLLKSFLDVTGATRLKRELSVWCSV